MQQSAVRAGVWLRHMECPGNSNLDFGIAKVLYPLGMSRPAPSILELAGKLKLKRPLLSPEEERKAIRNAIAERLKLKAARK